MLWQSYASNGVKLFRLTKDSISWQRRPSVSDRKKRSQEDPACPDSSITFTESPITVHTNQSSPGAAGEVWGCLELPDHLCFSEPQCWNKGKTCGEVLSSLFFEPIEWKRRWSLWKYLRKPSLWTLSGYLYSWRLSVPAPAPVFTKFSKVLIIFKILIISKYWWMSK